MGGTPPGILSSAARLIQSLRLRGPEEEGLYRARWDGLTREGRPAANGIYLLRLARTDLVPAARLLLVR